MSQNSEPSALKMLIFVLIALYSGSVVQSKIESISDVQNLILNTINETAPDFHTCNENLLQKAVFSDMIEINRNGYFHWAVFVSNTTVIQLNNPEFDKLNVDNAFENFTGQVELRNLIELAGKDFCRINNKMNESKRKGLNVLTNSEILEGMKKELKKNVTFYNIFNYNCEHFAAKLKFGVSFSSQIEAVKEISKKNEVKEIVARMFKVAAQTGPSMHSKEGLADLFSVLL